MNTSEGDQSEWRDGMEAIAGAIRPIMHVTEGSGRLTPIGSAFAVSHLGTRYLITADHVLAGLSDKLMGVDEQFSAKWPRTFSRLVANDASLPDADVAWVEFRMFEETLSTGATIPIEQTLARVAGGNENGFVAVGHPVSKARMVDAQSAVKSRLMMAQVRLASDTVKAALNIDERVQMALSYNSDTHVDLESRAIVPATPKGMSGGVVVATTRAKDVTGRPYMKPYVVGVLTRYSVVHRTYVATKLDQLWTAIGLVRRSGELLYRRVDGTYVPETDL